jgi:Holliday junction DNA helicase RuvA
MLAYIEGIIDEVSDGSIILRVGGFGISINVLTKSGNIYDLLGKRTVLYTSLVVKDGYPTIYGFVNSSQNTMFGFLTSVSGIGPKNAMAILDSLGISQIVNSITVGDSTLLNSVSGIGPKTAARIVLELKDKLDQFIGFVLEDPTNDDVNIFSAMQGLGYSDREIRIAISDTKFDTDLSFEDKIKMLLKKISEPS